MDKETFDKFISDMKPVRLEVDAYHARAAWVLHGKASSHAKLSSHGKENSSSRHCCCKVQNEGNQKRANRKGKDS